MRKSLWLILGLMYLILLEIAKVYFIMPFPGSQQFNVISIAYFLHNNIWWLRIMGIVLMVGPASTTFSDGNRWGKITLVLAFLLYGFIYYLFNFRFLAEKMFHEPKLILFADGQIDTTNRNKLIIGVINHNQAKAYPIEIIGYHHQIKDSFQQQPILVTYCTVCRTGRVYSPFINGKFEQFRLVGMDHFNALFEDATTKSWWQQATGVAISGKLKGEKLTEIPSVQMRLGDWLDLYPNSEILQSDSNFTKNYADLKGFDEGTIKGKLEHRDSLSWKMKSWVLGININNKTKAYDWNNLIKQRMISDSLAGMQLLVTIDPNGKSFYALNRKLNQQILQFLPGANTELMLDTQTRSIWKLNGTCISGTLQGNRLEQLQIYQEFWHSWKNFHPNTNTYQN